MVKQSCLAFVPFIGGKFVMHIAAVMIVSFGLIFVFSLLEVVWLTVYDDDVVAHESRHGKNRTTKTVKGLLRERMVVVGFVLFAIHLLTYFTPLLLGWLSQNENGLVHTMLVVYAIVLFFAGEVISKNIGYRWAMRSALISAMPLQWLLKICFPITWALKLTNGLTGGKDLRLFRQEDVVAAAKAAEEHGTIHPVETDFIEGALAAGDRTVGSFIIPIDACTCVPIKVPRGDLRRAARRHSKIVVYAPDGKTIVGIVTTKDIIPMICGKSEDVIGLTKAVRPVVNLPMTTPIPEAIQLLRRQPIGVATGQDGKPVGIVVTNDIFDWIIEQIPEGE